ncbi:VOC family protein [Nocardia sp. NPDC050710]|uniref:VOC family protein n=1 Tax=Nocardia sp. NPDC050710 TaxID=3157220 RepID=UPI0033C25E83
MSDVAPNPEGYQTLCPVLVIDGAAAAIDFYKQVFGADERMRTPRRDGTVAHCELRIGDSLVILGDAAPDRGLLDPKAIGGTPVTLHVFVDDADVTFAAALAAGARELRPLTTKFYGDRSGTFEDPWGHSWMVATQVEDIFAEQMRKRTREMGQ